MITIDDSLSTNRSTTIDTSGDLNDRVIAG